MYGVSRCLALPILSTDYTNTSIPTRATPTAAGLAFTFEDNHLGVTGTLTILTDATEVTAVEIGGPDPADQLEVGDWAFAHTRIDHTNTATLADEGLDAETLDTLRSLIYSAIGYTLGHAAPITARLTPAPAPAPTPSAEAVRTAPPCPCACNSGGWCGGCGHAGCGRR